MNCPSPLAQLCSHSMSAFESAESYGDHRSLDNLAGVHQERVKPSPGPEGLELQPGGLYSRRDPSCHNSLQADDARTH